jgi:hypothetical protein
MECMCQKQMYQVNMVTFSSEMDADLRIYIQRRKDLNKKIEK